MKRRTERTEEVIGQYAVPTSGPALRFDAEGDIAEALIQSLLDQAHSLAGEVPSLVFVVEGRSNEGAHPVRQRFSGESTSRPCTLVFTEPAPMPLVRAMIKVLGGGMLTPVRLEALRLRPLLRIDGSGFSLFGRPVSAEVEA